LKMKKITIFLFITLPVFILAQNVGIGTTTPVEKLDVSGNINLTGTIKANGLDGTANQVLMKNNSGLLSWGDMCDFKNMATFTTPGSGNWIVPANVKRIWIEVWGAGGGGGAFGGGGGGGYVMGFFTVAENDVINYTVGSGGAGGSNGTNGGQSLITAGTVTLTAFGGEGSVLASGVITNGAGGNYSVSAGFTNNRGMRGGIGTPKSFRFFSNGATNYQETAEGNGGDGANAPGTGGAGRLRIYNITAAIDIFVGLPEQGKQPGGGGGSGIGGIGLPTTGNGAAGASGAVIFHY
jgi:hypothetical protein